jgi:hypothetical protein
MREHVYDYERVCGLLVQLADSKRGRGFLVIAESPIIDHVFAPTNNEFYASLLSSLVLSFPEFYWVLWSQMIPEIAERAAAHFISIQSPSGDGVRSAMRIRHLGNILHLAGSEAFALFDGGGLRKYIFDKLEQHAVGVGESGGRTTSSPLCLVIDDERTHALLAAYAAYAAGCQASTITCRRSVDVIGFLEFHENIDDRPEFAIDDFIAKPEIVIEDLYMNFIDRRPDEHYSNLETGRTRWPWLNDVDRRLILTYGEGAHAGDFDASVRFLKASAANRSRGILIKPISGLYDLQSLRRVRWFGDVRGSAARREFWPPASKDAPPPAGLANDGHSAPGRLLMVAEFLVARARQRLQAHRDLEDAVAAAVMARDAIRLLGGKTPTTAIEALSILHRSECTIECSSHGVAQDYAIDVRLAGIQAELDRIGLHFDRKHRRACVLDAEVGIVNELIQIFRKYGQFDEEQVLLSRNRQLHYELMVLRKKRGPLWRLVGGPINRYLNYCISGGAPRILALTALWLAVSIVAMVTVAALSPRFLGETGADMGDVLCLVSYFLTLNSPTGFCDSSWGMVFLIAVGIVSVLHLGVFLAHLYNLIARR